MGHSRVGITAEGVLNDVTGVLIEGFFVCVAQALMKVEQWLLCLGQVDVCPLPLDLLRQIDLSRIAVVFADLEKHGHIRGVGEASLAWMAGSRNYGSEAVGDLRADSECAVSTRRKAPENHSVRIDEDSMRCL